jgi:hypothetical protein
MDPNATPELQLRTLAANVERLRNWIVQVQSEIDARVKEHVNALREEEGVRARHDEELRERLKTAATSGLYVGYIGALWLFLGVLLSTISKEITDVMP